MINRNKYIIRKDTGCWEWQGAKTATGYGRMKVDNKAWMAHRYSLKCHLGRELKDGCVVLHTCDNPCCINPEHLREGTQKENMQDCKQKARLGPRGGRHNKLPVQSASEERIKKVINAHNRGWKPSAISSYFKLSPAWVSKVIQDYLYVEQ